MSGAESTHAAVRFKLAVLVVLLVALALSPALGASAISGRVTDLAGLIPETTEFRIEQKLEELENRTGAQVAVLTVPTLGGVSPEEFALREAEGWGLGRAEHDDGVLLLVAQQERKLRLEVGYGLEGDLTDVLSGRILDNIVTPAFRQGDFGGGLERAVDAIISVVEGAELPPALEAPPTASLGEGCFTLLAILFLVVLPMMMRYRDYRRGWSSRHGWAGPWIIGSSSGRSSSGGFGGSFGGFSGGGGGFGGGGASGGW